MKKFDIHIVRGNGGPAGELVGRLETLDFNEAVNLNDYSFGKQGAPVEVSPGVWVLQPFNDVGHRVLVTEDSIYFNTPISQETYENWYDLTEQLIM